MPGPAVWREAYRVLKPGGHLVAFFGTRTYDLGVLAIRLAGFEIRDQLAWVYGSGFPKSLDVSKAIDKAAGAERTVVGTRVYADGHVQNSSSDKLAPPIGTFVRTQDARLETTPTTPAAQQWHGWGTSLKPSQEPLVLAVKPLTLDTERRLSVESLLRLESHLWLIARANGAEALSVSKLAGRHDRDHLVFAEWSVDEPYNILAALSDQTGTSPSVSEVTSCLNTVSSWLDTLVGISKPENTSIIETTSSTTIDWKTLRFCLSAITPVSIVSELTQRSGTTLPAELAARYLRDLFAKLQVTHELTALAPAIERMRIDSLGVDGSTELRPIVLARKPLIGTVAQNVQTYGTGALNIDACRVGTSGGTSGSSGYDRLADADTRRWRGVENGEGCDDNGPQAGRNESDRGTEHGGSLRSDGRPGPTNGLWRDADWLYCRDDKWRPVEPGLEPLANGTANRVGRLRGYGNAITLSQAEAFMRAVLDVC